MPSFTVPLYEYNHCHSPEDGKFCSTGGVKATRGIMRQTTRVGITSQRPEGAPGHKSNRDVFQKDMEGFRQQLSALPGVSGVSVKPGVGAWQGGSEPTWVVAYRGNGEATKLLAKTGKQFEQDAVLVMRGCRGKDCSPAVELVFEKGISGTVRDAIHGVLGSYKRADGSQIIGGWTWLKRNGKTVLRMVAVPQLGGEATEHVNTTREISTQLAALGLTHGYRQKPVRIEVMEREGDHAYDTYLR